MTTLSRLTMSVALRGDPVRTRSARHPASTVTLYGEFLPVIWPVAKGGYVVQRTSR
jgi:hypothetical protein